MVQLDIDDDMQLQIFNELQGKIQHILRAVKAIVAVHKNSLGGAGNADSMGLLIGPKGMGQHLSGQLAVTKNHFL